MFSFHSGPTAKDCRSQAPKLGDNGQRPEWQHRSIRFGSFRIEQWTEHFQGEFCRN